MKQNMIKFVYVYINFKKGDFIMKIFPLVAAAVGATVVVLLAIYVSPLALLLAIPLMTAIGYAIRKESDSRSNKRDSFEFEEDKSKNLKKKDSKHISKEKSYEKTKSIDRTKINKIPLNPKLINGNQTKSQGLEPQMLKR